MSWSFRVIRILGTEVKVHVTFLLVLAFFYAQLQMAGGSTAAIMGTLLFVSLFLCVLLHEFGHILMARHFGIRTPDVILLPIGGMARLERIPEEPKQELLIALAGPAVTLGIAAGLFLLLNTLGQPVLWTSTDQTEPTIVKQLFYMNVLLLAFNLIPAFPMDGGRVLRAILASRMNYARATRIAATIGQSAAILGGLTGLFLGQTMWVLVAAFVFFAAGQEAAMVQTRAAGRGIIVDQMMVTRFLTIPVFATLRQAVDLLLETEQGEFPVVDNNGAVEGLLTRDNLIRGLTDRGPDSLVSASMTRPVPTLPLGLAFEAALGRLRGSGLPALPVVDTGGKLVGLLTMDNITDLILVRQATAK